MPYLQITNADIQFCDVAVIGSGFAGLSAAIEASNMLPETGKILIVEKMSVAGGNSVMNAGQIAAVGSKAQRASGIQDSVELMMSDMMKAGVDLNHPNLIRKMIEDSNMIVEWTEQELGVQYRDRVTQLGGHSVPRTLRCDIFRFGVFSTTTIVSTYAFIFSTINACGNDIINPMLKLVKKRPNIQLLCNSTFEKFILGDEGNHVTGIQVVDTTNAQQKTILCKRGVVAASGGFSADVSFRSIQNPSFDHNVMTTNQPGATAEVLREALRIGAMPVQLSRIQLGPWTSPDEDGFGNAPFFCLGAGFPYGIIVDPQTATRFVNELGNRYERSMSILKMGHPAICFVDSIGAQHSLKKELDELTPAVKSFGTIKELAEYYQMDPTYLSKTVNLYNAGVVDGQDEFGKTLRDDLKPIDSPPFYAVRLWPKVHHTMGGLHINDHAQVINIDGNPIKGLYAAGEVAGGVHGGDRLGSCATLDCIAFGRIAGHQAATTAPVLVLPPKK